MGISHYQEQRKKQISMIQPPPAPAEPGNKRALSHGAYSFLISGIIPCNKCLIKDECEEFRPEDTCIIIESFQIDKVKEIMDLPHIQPQDATLAQMLARELAFQAIVAKFIAKVGLFRGDQARRNQALVLQPVLNSYWTSVNAATRMCDQLGLSPMARSRLKIESQGFDFAEAIQEVNEK